MELGSIEKMRTLCLEVMKNLDSFDKVRNKDYFMMLNAPMRI